MAPVTAELMSVTGMRLEISGVTDEAAPAGAASAQLDQPPAEQDVADLLAFAQTIGSQAQIRPVPLQAGPLEAEPADAGMAAPLEQQPMALKVSIEADESVAETRPPIMATPVPTAIQPVRAPAHVEAQLAPEVLRSQQAGSKRIPDGLHAAKESAQQSNPLPVEPAQSVIASSSTKSEPRTARLGLFEAKGSAQANDPSVDEAIHPHAKLTPTRPEPADGLGLSGEKGSAQRFGSSPVGPVQPNIKQMPSGTQAAADVAAPSMPQDEEVTSPHPPRDPAHSFRPVGLASLVGQVPTSEQATASHTPRDGGHLFRPFDLASLVGPASTAEQAAAPAPLRSFDSVMPQVLAALAPAFEPAAAMQSAAPLPAEVLAEHQLDLASDGVWLDQLARDIAGAGEDGAPLRFRLNPEMLGSLRVEIRQEQAGAAVRLTAETEAARAIIADAQPRLVAEARAQGCASPKRMSTWAVATPRAIRAVSKAPLPIRSSERHACCKKTP
jgi:hypothetical protein